MEKASLSQLVAYEYQKEQATKKYAQDEAARCLYLYAPLPYEPKPQPAESSEVNFEVNFYVV